MDIKKQKFKIGFTTGTCAHAAAKASAIMLVTQKKLNKIVVNTQAGVKFNIKLIDQKIGKDFAKCGVVKNSGDDPDVTNGVKIYAEIRFLNKKEIKIIGGVGVGIVTKKGLPMPVGEHAINPVPREMIYNELLPLLALDKGFEVIISVPEGEKLATKTFNPKLGIKGGISIIGTTGVVIPRSEDAYKSSLSLQLDVLKAGDHKKCVLVLGYIGEKFCKSELKISDDLIIKIGDHIGFMFDECIKKGIEEILLIGHVSKLIKLVNNQFNTNIKFGDNRINTIVAYTERFNVDKKIIDQINEQTTVEAACEILKENGLEKIFKFISKDILKQINIYTNKKIKVKCIVLTLNGEVLGKC